MISASLNHRHKKIASSFKDLLKGYYMKPLDEALLKKILRLIQHNEESPKGKEKFPPLTTKSRGFRIEDLIRILFKLSQLRIF